MNSISLKFDEKNDDVLIWNGQVVMSRTEEEYFDAIFTSLAYLKPRTVLEIGFGLGISANFIQEKFSPQTHDIFEIEKSIFEDLEHFAKRHTSVRPFSGDWRCSTRIEKYDFIFFDPYDYFPDDNATSNNKAEAPRLLKALLEPEGVLCHPHFGNGDVPDVFGFDTVIVKRLKLKAIKMFDGTYCEDVAIVFHRPRP